MTIDQTPQRPHLTFLTRSKDKKPGTASQAITLIPRELLENTPELADAYDQFVNTRTARNTAYREARQHRDAADTSRRKYQAAVSEAVRNGGDTSKLTDKHDDLIAKAEAAEAVGRNADGQLLRVGNELGEAFAAHAHNLFPAIEADITNAASHVATALDALTQAWNEYAKAWHLRRITGNAHIYGGPITNYDPNIGLPNDVAPALKVMSDRLNDLDTLKADEAEINRFRINGN
ncbi:hypothetical protein [Microbacterium maritypicum]|uniref:Uncharacterized protein n=1 Tax=Microbacterium maritypicum TaxID=33918 RepID=A0ACD4B4T3_MICMQ|nr:hypothetical protein [Microbacterium liquefaciens]UTT52318.1 hypothetical protein NMQ05_14725 [Microbacterium liquefaciens]